MFSLLGGLPIYYKLSVIASHGSTGIISEDKDKLRVRQIVAKVAGEGLLTFSRPAHNL